MNLQKIFGSLPRWLHRQKLVRFLLLLSPDSRVQPVEFNGGAKLFADLSDSFAASYFLAHSFEPEFFSIAAPFLAKGGVFFDVGANFGFCSFGLIHALPNVRVSYYLFEANGEICKLLRESAALHPSKTLVIRHCCVTDHAGRSQLHVPRKNQGSAYVAPEGAEAADNLLLDEYVRASQIPCVDFLKMDVEGSEPAALRGALKSLSSGRIKAVYLEVSTMNLSRYGWKPKDCLGPLRESGFSLFWVKENDFRRRVADAHRTVTLTINDSQLKVCPLEDFPSSHQTDVLALHESSEWFGRNKGFWSKLH